MPGWGVSEFWLYDPCWEHNRRLRCLGLAEGRYWLLPPKCRNDSLLAVNSRPSGLELHLDGRWLRLWDPVVEDYLRTSSGAERERLVKRAGGFEERAEAEAQASARRRGPRESGRSPRGSAGSTGLS